jgi:SNF2 family DNA or RNA helicase
MRQRSDFRAYQEEAVRFAMQPRSYEFFPGEQRRTGLFIDMGLGKTAVSLTVVEALQAALQAGPVLVIGPLRVCRMVWPTEVFRWAHLRGLRMVNLAGLTERAREKALSKPADIYVLNRENVRWITQFLHAKKLPFTGIVIDESSSFKDRSTARWKAMKKLSRRVNFICLLTGTPAPNALWEIYPQVSLLDDGERLGKSFTAFMERHFVSTDYHGYKKVVKPGHDKIIYDLISDICLSLRSEDYLELPPCLYTNEVVHLPDQVKRQYREMEKKLVFSHAEDGVVAAVNAAVLHGKLLQMASGAVYDEQRAVIHLHDEKLLVLKETVEELQGAPMLVAYCYTHERDRIKKAFPYAEVASNDPTMEERWNRGEIKMLLGHARSLGHGLNLQFGGCDMVWFSLTSSLEEYLQYNKRLPRSGQTRPVRIRHLIAEGTVDEDVLRVLSDREATQDALMEALKLRVEMVLREGGAV